MEERDDGTWFSDDPLPPDSDGGHLNRETFVESIVALLEKVGRQQNSSVLGLIGPWGSGKSSILNGIANRMRSTERTERRWVITEFNPWYYQDLASLQSGFFRELSSSVPNNRSWRKFRQRVADLGDALAPLGSLGAVVGVDASGAIGGVSSLIRGGTSIESVKTAVESELRKADRPILVVIDDVDRLDPAELLLLFKLIRLAGRLKNVYYLLAYDEDTLLDALGRTGLIGADTPRRAIDYLEKIVQIRLDVPPLRGEQVSTWVDHEVEALAERHSVEIDSEFESRFSRAYFGHLRARLTTPRAIKRYFAQVDAFLSQVRGEVDFVDFLVLSWLRASEPLIYRGLIDNRSRLLGEFDWATLGSRNRGRDVDADHRYWRDFFSTARVDPSRTAGVAELVGLLFPRFAHEWSDTPQVFSGWKPGPGRISNPDYFDRFFALGVPEEDLSDRVVAEASRQILERRDGLERQIVEAAWPERANLVIGKLSLLWRPGDTAVLPGLTWLARQFEKLPEHKEIADSRMRARWFGRDLYVGLDERNADAFIAGVGSDPKILQFCAFLVDGAHLRREEQGEARASGSLPSEQRLGRLIAGAFEAQAAANPLDYPDDVWYLIRTWERLDSGAVQRWADLRLTQGDWPVLDLLARMVGTIIPLGVRDPVARIDGLDLQFVDRVVGLARVQSDLANEIQRALPSIEREAPATPDNRRAFVLATLQSHFQATMLEEEAALHEPNLDETETGSR
ncbi:P-loop NTPase fold protein [Microbacterium sp. B2969]|uniref:P-loop NTPase fold protein n=1 Tax=Microbacterium alkaliflavum TaxID=3248839 RepID=A0ABW7Q9G8_9MICO